MNKIFIVEDNLFNTEDAEKIHNYFKNLSWSYNGQNKTENSLKWNYFLKFDHINEINFFDLSNKLLIKHQLDKTFKFKRCYASANTYGFSGEYHEDENVDNYNKIITIMFYLNNKWKLEFGGETFFLNHDKDEIEHAIIPKPGRAVIFDGFITHGPRPLSKFCNELRMVLTFKYDLINNSLLLNI